MKSILQIEHKKRNILKYVINNTPGLRRYMIIHSIFDINSLEDGDWLAKFMLNELYPTNEEVSEAHKKDDIPQFVLDSLSIFDPMPLGFEKHYDNVKIYYKMYGDWKTGESTTPVTIIDKTWEGFGKKMSNEDLEEIISSYGYIDI